MNPQHPRSAAPAHEKGISCPLTVSVCVCTFRRPQLLSRLLQSLQEQRLGENDRFDCVVVDNDASESARSVVGSFLDKNTMPVTYDVEPERNLALVRNRALALASGDLIAFIDDDEVATPTWLCTLLDARRRFSADGVLGPVRPYYEVEPPSWVTKGGLCDRPVHATGTLLHWRQTRTGNALLHRSVFDNSRLAFDSSYATGGEDVDFFKRAMDAGYRFVWCEEAPVYECVPSERLRKAYFLKRALLQGGISSNYASNSSAPQMRICVGIRSLIALLVYMLCTPMTMLWGFHLTMTFLIKSCHHAGRLLALCGVKMRERCF